MLDESKIILCDVDDVLWYFVEEWIQWLNAKHGFNKDVSECNAWDIELMYPSLSGEQLYEPLFLNSFWKKVKPREDAMEYIPKLQKEGYKIKLCSATNFRHADKKFDYLLEYFPTITDDDIILTSDKTLVRGKYLIDDRWQNLANRECPILMTVWHNRNVTLPERAIRVKGWKEIYTYITGKKEAAV